MRNKSLYLPAVEQVLRLVHYLVKYGYYGNTDDIKQLMRPLLDLMDGRNDKPYIKASDSKDGRWLSCLYRSIDR